jgi:hypothetical protein
VEAGFAFDRAPDFRKRAHDLSPNRLNTWRNTWRIMRQTQLAPMNTGDFPMGLI